jgi:GMP synthase-like glutamine amidotransferase
MKRVLILDGSIWPELYRPSEQWRALIGDVPSDAVHLPSGETVPDPARYTHVIVTGSEASITGHEPWYDVEADAVRRAVDLRLAVLGSCFGHQMLVRALSGEGFTAASPTPELGWTPIHLLGDDPLFDGLQDTFWAFVSHFDEVRDPPPPWRVLARSDGCDVQAIRYGDAPVWGIQAHPEIPPAQGRALLEGFLVKHPEREGLIRPALESTPRDDGTIGEIVARFLEVDV